MATSFPSLACLTIRIKCLKKYNLNCPRLKAIFISDGHSDPFSDEKGKKYKSIFNESTTKITFRNLQKLER